MKLLQYFNQQSEHQLSEERKLALLARINEKKQYANSTLLKRARPIKQMAYSFMALGLVFVFFGTYFWDSITTTNYRAFFATKTPSADVTLAGVVAEILEINGEYVIEKDGKQFVNSVLFDGDLITLKEDAKIIFNLDQDAKVEVKGPAQFIITTRGNGGYRLKLLNGEFLKIDAQKSNTILEVETEKFTLQASKDTQIGLELTKHNQQFQVKNTGATLLITQKTEEQTPAATKLEKQKMLTMQENDITKIEDLTTFRQTLAQSNITHTYSADPLQEDTLALEEVIQALSGEAAQILDAQQAEAMRAQLDREIDTKKIPTEAQLSQMTAALNSQFLMSDVQAIYLAKLNQDAGALDQAYLMLGEKIKTLAQIYQLTIKVGTTRSELIGAITALKQGLEAYHIPPSKIQQLTTLQNWLIHFAQLEPTVDWASYKAQLPGNLIFQ